MMENAPAAGWERSDHEGLVHTHRRFHITHIQNFEHEHAGEAHIHDHDQPAAPGKAGLSWKPLQHAVSAEQTR